MVNYTEDRWQWYAGADEERLNVGPHKTRDKAIQDAIDQQIYNELDPDTEHPEWRISVYVCECVRPEVIDMTIDGDRVLEQLDDHYEEFAYEDALFANVTREQQDDLGRMLTEALHAWAARHGIRFPSWCYQESRNVETVVLPHPENKQ